MKGKRRVSSKKKHYATGTWTRRSKARPKKVRVDDVPVEDRATDYPGPKVRRKRR